MATTSDKMREVLSPLYPGNYSISDLIRLHREATGTPPIGSGSILLNFYNENGADFGTTLQDRAFDFWGDEYVPPVTPETDGLTTESGDLIVSEFGNYLLSQE